jgi:hypothetical protein
MTSQPEAPMTPQLGEEAPMSPQSPDDTHNMNIKTCRLHSHSAKFPFQILDLFNKRFPTQRPKCPFLVEAVLRKEFGKGLLKSRYRLSCAESQRQRHKVRIFSFFSLQDNQE